MKRSMILLVLVMVISGCTTVKNGQWETMLNRAQSPCTVVSISVNETGIPQVLFRDNRGKYFSLMGFYLGTLKTGDVLF